MPSSLQCDILVLGAGAVGSGVALALSERNSKLKIVVADVDLDGTFSSTELNAGGVRATFNLEHNVRFSKRSLDYFKLHGDEIGFLKSGYLWLKTGEQMDRMTHAESLWEQYSLGVKKLTLKGLRSAWNFIDKTDDLGGAWFSPEDGLINPNLLKKHYRVHAIQNGVQFLDRMYFEESSGQKYRFLQLPKVVSQDDLKNLLCGKALTWSGALESKEIVAKQTVVCMGAWAAPVLKRLKFPLNVYPQKRQIALFDLGKKLSQQPGMIVDSSGVYFHPESTFFLSGIALNDDQKDFNFDTDGEGFFTEKLWPSLFERSSYFEQLKFMTSWAGLYEVSPDESAIIGPICSDGSLWECHSFSGHGLMHSYWAGQTLADWMLKGQPIDRADLDFSRDRFKDGSEAKWLRETAVI